MSFGTPSPMRVSFPNRYWRRRFHRSRPAADIPPQSKCLFDTFLPLRYSFAQPVGGEIVAVVGRAFQPIDALGGIMNVSIVGEIQLAEGVLRRVQVLLGGAFQQLLCFDRVGYQQSAVTVRRADDVLRMSIACIRKLLQLAPPLRPVPPEGNSHRSPRFADPDIHSSWRRY